MPLAVITGASAGLGRALASALLARGWQLVVDARGADRLARAYAGRPGVLALAGDVSDAGHQAELAAAVGDRALDLLINNASTLGPTPLPLLRELEPAALAAILRVNVLAPLALIQRLLPNLERAGGCVLNVSSDAAVTGYPGWGGYGAAKAALDQLTRTLAAEQGGVRWYAVDPGDLRTEMHQAAFPGEDISDRPEPATVVAPLLSLIEGHRPSGRYPISELVPA